MMKKKHLVLLCLSLSILLVSCGSNDETMRSTSSAVTNEDSSLKEEPSHTLDEKSEHAIRDNPTYYKASPAGHEVAETEDGYYVLLNQLLFYVDKVSTEAVLLSAENRSAQELQEDPLKKEKSDAFFPDDSDLFFVDGKLYIFANGDLVRLAAEGGPREKLATIKGYQSACFSQGSFIVEQVLLNEKGESVASLSEVDLDGRVKDFYHFSSMLNEGRFLSLQRLFPYQGKIYVHSLVHDPEKPNEGAERTVLTIIDRANAASRDMELEYSSGGKNYGMQFLSVFQDQLAMTVFPLGDQRLKPDAKLVYYNQNGEKEEEGPILPWPQVFLSNGSEAVLIPSPVTWISKTFDGGEELSENKKEDLLIQSSDGKTRVKVEDSLLEQGKTVEVYMANNGQVLIKNEADLLILVDGDHLTQVVAE